MEEKLHELFSYLCPFIQPPRETDLPLGDIYTQTPGTSQLYVKCDFWKTKLQSEVLWLI